MIRQEVKQGIDSDEQYLLDSLVFIQNKLVSLRYNIKEIKACLLVATENKNENRIFQIQDQKGKTNDLIKESLEDQRHVLSIYKKIKGGNRK